MPVDLAKLEDSPHLVDILIQLEDVLDGLDIYCYFGWFDGQICDGPRVGRHWVSFTLLYPMDKMPDPRACLRLLKHGIRVEYSKVKRDTAGEHARNGSDGRMSPLTKAGPLAPMKNGLPPALPVMLADGTPAVDALDSHAPPSAKLDDKNMDWMVKVIFPRHLLDQMAAEDLDMYEDDVDTDDIEDAKDSGMNDESAYDQDAAPPGDQAFEGDGTDTPLGDETMPPGAPS